MHRLLSFFHLLGSNFQEQQFFTLWYQFSTYPSYVVLGLHILYSQQ